ncbi:MAG: APC family permease, partial [Saprospiraceae bacterium]
SQLLASISTTLKLLVMAGIIALGFIFYEPQEVNLNLTASVGEFDNLGTALLTALVGVLWSFGGWHHASYLAGETIDAKRTVPRAMVLGTIIVTTIYVLINLAYMLLLPLDAIAQTQQIAGEALGSVFAFGGKLAAIAVAISIFGTIGIYTMSAPRIYFAMAKDGIFFKQLSYIHPKYKTPVFAMLLQCVWAIVLLLFWGTFEELIEYVTFTDIIFMTLAGISLFVFRRTRKEQERPYKVIGYPIIPLIFITISAAFVLNTLLVETKQAVAGLILLGLGVPVYYLFKRYNGRGEE